MVLIRVDGFNDYVGSVPGQGLERILEIRLHAGVEDVAAVFGRPYQVVVAQKDGMGHSAVYSHATNVARLSRGKARKMPEGASSHELTLGELRRKH